jgi:hypothetical protein
MRSSPRETAGTPPRSTAADATLFRPQTSADWISSALFVLAIAFQIAIAWNFRALTWDDSAITLGFSRTLAMTGRIEPTPGSGIVEGYSTTLWMLLMAAVATVVRNPYTLLAVAKIATLLLNIASLFLVRAWLRTWMPAALATLIAGICGCSFMHFETINGMETPLLLALVLSLLVLRQSAARNARWLYLAAGVGVVLTRWESVLLLIPFVLLERPLRRATISATVWASAFAVTTILRRLYFGDFLPNTLIAKRGAPYLTGTPHEQLGQHLLQLRFLVSYASYFAAIVLLYLLVRSRFVRSQPASARRAWQFRFTALFVAFSVVLTVGIGYNWGPPLRSFYTAWPFLIALLLYPLARDWNRPELRRVLLVAVGAMSLLTVARVGRIVQNLRSPYAPTYMPDATVGKINTMTGALQTIQQATGRRDLLFAGPDMGAVMLFSQGIRVIDLGLLCNRRLAHERYGVTDSYVLQQQKPDVIEVHGMWTGLTGMDSSRRFHEDYRMAMVDGRRVFLRTSLVASIAPSHLREMRVTPGGEASMHASGVGLGPEDASLSDSFGSYLLLTR